MLSVYDGDLTTPGQSYRHYTEELRLSSTGLMAVTASECRAIDLSPSSDPELFPEHAVIDFSGLSEKSIKTKAKILKSRAMARGWLYRDE